MKKEVMFALAEQILMIQPRKSKFFEDHLLCDNTEIKYSKLGFGIDRFAPDDLERLAKALAKKLYGHNYVYYYAYNSPAEHCLFRLSE